MIFILVTFQLGMKLLDCIDLDCEPDDTWIGIDLEVQSTERRNIAKCCWHQRENA